MHVGYIGLGNMGAAMASHLAPAGLEVSVFDLVPARMEPLVEGGARATSSLRELAERADILCICVPDDGDVRAVLLGRDSEGGGALEYLAKGAVIAIHSTVHPDTIAELAAHAQARGCSLVDAAVTGGGRQARAGELTFLVGSDAASLDRLQPVLAASSKRIIHAGPAGSGAKLKLAVNVLTYAHYRAVHEALELATGLGIEAQHWIDATRSNEQLSDNEMEFLNTCVLPRAEIASEAHQNAMRISVVTAEKDLSHALDLAKAHNIPMPAIETIRGHMATTFRLAPRADSQVRS